MPRAGDFLLASLLMVVGIGVLAGQDVIVKWLSPGFSIWELFLFRAVSAFLLLAATLSLLRRPHTLRTRRLGRHVARGSIAFGAFTCYYLAVAVLPLVDAIAIFYTAPLMATAFSAPLLGETVSRRRWAAVGVGFAGAIVMIQPGSGVVSGAAWLALASAVAYAFVVILTRQLGATEASTTIASYTMILHAAMAGVMVLALAVLEPESAPGHSFLTRPWAAPDGMEIVLMVTSGAALAIGFVCLARAYSLAPVALVTPYEYTGVVWAALWGYAIWHDVPSGATLLGGALVIAAGLYNAREGAVS
jgi:drug/metabolite transporter (DMT)-like permease